MAEDNLKSRIQQVNKRTLLPLVQRALASNTVKILDWHRERIHGGTFGIVYRFKGKGQEQGGALAWSLILKVVHNSPNAPIPRNDPENQRYWKREPLVYLSGFLADLQGLSDASNKITCNLVAPRCFDVVEQADDEIWLWLEDVAEKEDTPWSKDRYVLAARHIGQFSGTCLQNKSLLAKPWLGKDLLRAQAKESAADFVERLPQARQHPLIQRFLPDEIAAGVFQLWQDRELFFETIEKLPQTVCHRDACHVNLFARRLKDGSEQTIAIDWEDVARGPIGEDLVSLILVGLLHSKIPLTDGPAFDAYLFESYLKGLHDSGWRGQPPVARLGYTASCIRYGLALIHYILSLALDENSQIEHQTRSGQPIEETADHWAAVYRFILDRTDEARQLMNITHLNRQ